MTWQEKLKENIYTIDQLQEYIKLTPEEITDLKKVAKLHPMNITPYYLSLIDKDNLNDPIRNLIVPSIDELDASGSYDTSGESENTKAVGLQHKYGQTALILATNRCAAYCRHCFRKRLVGLPNKEILQRFDDAAKYIEQHSEIDNVLISGGDPLVLPTDIVEKFLQLLTPIKHLRYIRIGTRIPVVFPDRILEDKQLLSVLKKYSGKKEIDLITHFNHPKEITPQSTKALKKIIASNVPVYNQTVLLKTVNNDPDVLADLFNKLINIGALPYYLFQCRPVKRVKHHFQVSLEQGYQIFHQAKAKMKNHILCKRIKYIMSHRTGKVEIIGVIDDEIFFKYHQAKNPKNLNKFFKKKLKSTAGWLDDLD